MTKLTRFGLRKWLLRSETGGVALTRGNYSEALRKTAANQA